MNLRDWSRYRGKDVLLLQGPVGPYFARFRRRLESCGARVHKVNFNGGDWLFYPHGARAYLGSAAGWPAWFEAELERTKASVVFLFGDCRPLHRVAHEIAEKRGIEVGVFEEGYIRSGHFITLEFGGVNGFSSLPRDPDYYRALPPAARQPEQPAGKTFGITALWAMLYYLAATLAKPVFLRYRHHRPLHIFEGLFWIRSYWRKYLYRSRERGLMEELTGPLSKRFYLVPLQIATDAQIRVHSEFANVAAFLCHAVASFANHAPPGTALVIKHHPLDRGYHDYSRTIRGLAARHGLSGRLFYIHDQHLPTLLDHARGVVTVNSTAGLSALIHGVPVKACGNAIYDMDGLTWQGGLDSFWDASERFKIDASLLESFRSHLTERTQINDNFYRPVPQVEERDGTAVVQNS